MTPVHQVTMLKFIKNLSMLSTTIESLHSADAIEFLIDLLSYSMKKVHRHLREITNQVLNTLFNLCRLSKERQEDAAVGGIIPLLLRIMKTDRPPKEFALPILCDMAHSGSKGRRYLWQNRGLGFFVSLLSDQYWQVTALDAILVWLQEETANVESHLVDGDFTRAIISCFSTNRLNAFDSNLLEPLLKLLRLSPSLTSSLAKPEMFAGITQRLGHKKAVVRLNLLRLVRTIIDACEPTGLGGGDGARTLNSAQVRSLMDSIQTLAETDSAVLVRNLASELVKSHAVDSPSMIAMRHDGMASSSQVNSASSSSRRGTRRNTSYTPASLQSSVSMPHTPTHRSRASLANNAFIEIAASPRRPAPMEREGSLYRPRSRDGPTGIPRRVSGDSSSLGGSSTGSNSAAAAAAKSRLPRTSLAASMAGRGGSGIRGEPAPPMVVRSDSNASNKENAGRHVFGPSGGGGVGNTSRESLVSRDSLGSRDGPGSRDGLGSRDGSVVAALKRRGRAPSDVKWYHQQQTGR